MKRVVVTRHAGLVQYLREIGMVDEDAQVFEHIEDPSVLDGAHVIGVVPLRLAARAALVTEIPLSITKEERGIDLPVERVREIAGAPVTYRVEVVE